jgi:hypothetical protein
MKALSLTQPYATAIAIGIKQWETRSWPTSFRGDICIHAAKNFPRWAKDFARTELTLRRLPNRIPLGGIICIAELTECRETYPLAQEMTAIERLYGDWSEGRYAFKLENVRVLAEPIPARGALGFWAVPWEEAVQVMRALRPSGVA